MLAVEGDGNGTVPTSRFQKMDYSAHRWFLDFLSWDVNPGPDDSEVCHWHLQKPCPPTLWFMSGVKPRSILNDCQSDDKASYYQGVVSPGLKTHSGGTEACRGEDKI